MTAARVGAIYTESATSPGPIPVRVAVEYIEAAAHPGPIPARVAVQWIEIVVSERSAGGWSVGSIRIG